MTPEEAQRKAKEIGHCLCNIKLPCPCPDWEKNKKCICSENLSNDTKDKDSQVEQEVIRDDKGKFVKGTPSPNPDGRPYNTKSIKTLVKEHLAFYPEDRNEFIRYFIKENRSLAWQMLEGRPPQDITSDNKPLASPIYGGLSKHDSNEEDIPADKED